MNKIDWGFWGMIVAIIVMLISLITITSGCALFQPRSDTSIIAPPPATQLWQAIKSSNWIITLSILGVAGGIFATLNGQKWGMAVIVSCCVSLFMALAVARFAWWMAICGLIGSLGLCTASILSRKRALIEIIKGVQNFRENDKVHRFAIDPKLKISQSKSTKKIVKKIKEKL